MFEEDTNEESRPISLRKSSVDSLFKVILLGDSKVGKSSILMRLVVILYQIDKNRTSNSVWSISQL